MEIDPALMKRILRNDEVVVESGDTLYLYKKMKMNRYFYSMECITPEK